MKNLFRTLIPYKWTALLVLLLMAGQAFCEMNLPQYTQALIDTGIQNRGIEHIVPEAAFGQLQFRKSRTRKGLDHQDRDKRLQG